MDDMQVYIANLGKYNEGELVGAWFTFPIDFEEVKEKIGLNDEYEEYAIHDYELPFTVDEYTSIGELNRLWEMVSELPEELQSELSALLTHFSSIEELSEHQEDIIIHSDCDDMYDVARYYIEETGALGEVPASLQNYIDYQAYEDDLFEQFHNEAFLDFVDPFELREAEEIAERKELHRLREIEKVKIVLSMMKPAQERRLYKFVIEGKSCREIAVEEGTYHSSVSKSIEAAKKNFKKFYENL